MSLWWGCLHSTLGCALPTISCRSRAERFDKRHLEAFGALGSSRRCRGSPAPRSCGRWGLPCTRSREGDWWCRSPSPWGHLPISRTWSAFSHRPPWSCQRSPMAPSAPRAQLWQEARTCRWWRGRASARWAPSPGGFSQVPRPTFGSGSGLQCVYTVVISLWGTPAPKFVLEPPKTVFYWILLCIRKPQAEFQKFSSTHVSPSNRFISSPQLPLLVGTKDEEYLPIWTLYFSVHVSLHFFVDDLP